MITYLCISCGAVTLLSDKTHSYTDMGRSVFRFGEKQIGAELRCHLATGLRSRSLNQQSWTEKCRNWTSRTADEVSFTSLQHVWPSLLSDMQICSVHVASVEASPPPPTTDVCLTKYAVACVNKLALSTFLRKHTLLSVYSDLLSNCNRAKNWIWPSLTNLIFPSLFSFMLRSGDCSIIVNDLHIQNLSQTIQMGGVARDRGMMKGAGILEVGGVSFSPGSGR